jgi:hypothetical protein
MNTAVLKTELAALNSAARREMLAYLVALERDTDQTYHRKLAAKIDDKEPTHWGKAENRKQKAEMGGGGGKVESRKQKTEIGGKGESRKRGSN